MILNATSVINQPVKLYLQASTGLTITTISVVNNGVIVSSPTISTVEVSGVAGLYCVTLTPTATGSYALFYNSNIFATLEIVTKSIYTYLANLEDEAIGSWVWDKQAGTLTMVRQDSSTLASFNVVESLLTASRERV